jgi:hypothetical protein
MSAMNKPIYALSGYAEWFWLMAKGWKDVENRDWSIHKKAPLEMRDKLTRLVTFPVRIYLHASLTHASRDERDFIWENLSLTQQGEYLDIDWTKYRGKIIGEITITHEVMELDSSWFFGKFGFLVQDGVLYDKPIPCRGQLGFFKPNISEVTKDYQIVRESPKNLTGDMP